MSAKYIMGPNNIKLICDLNNHEKKKWCELCRRETEYKLRNYMQTIAVKFDLQLLRNVRLDDVFFENPLSTFLHGLLSEKLLISVDNDVSKCTIDSAISNGYKVLSLDLENICINDVWKDSIMNFLSLKE